MDVAGILRTKGTEVVSARPETTVAEAVAILSAREIGALVVTNPADEVVGIVSERDVVRGLAEAGADFLARSLGACMASPVVTCAPGDTDREVMAMMTERRFRHLPVIDGGRLVGIVSIGDVVKNRIDGIAAEAEAMREYIQRG